MKISQTLTIVRMELKQKVVQRAEGRELDRRPYLTYSLRQFGADQVDVVLWQAVQHHEITSRQMIANQHMSLFWYVVPMMPVDLDSQDALQHCRKCTFIPRVYTHISVYADAHT